MAPLKSLPLWWIWLAVTVLRSADSQGELGQKIITAESGQNTTLTCRAPNNNNNIIVVEWSRADLGKEYVFMYRGGHFVPDEQHPSFKNRVDLQDRQMKDGDVSLILRDVTINDAGTYECRVVTRRTNRWKRANLKTDPITTISLNVDPPGQTERRAGLMLSLSLVAVFVGFLIYKKHKQQSQDSPQPSPAEQCEVEMSLSTAVSESPAAVPASQR